LMKYMRTQL
jgi:hypothetical protein